MVSKICEDCGHEFEASRKDVSICHECHKKRLSKWAKIRNLNKIGNDAYSKKVAERKKND